MGTGLQANLEIPDLWYDIYARFLPGTSFAFAIRYFIFGIYTIPTGSEIIMYIGAGYISALFIQPISYWIASKIEFCLLKKRKQEKLFIRAVQKKLGIDKHKSMILSKMGGEVAFYVQFALLSFVLFMIELFTCIKPIQILLLTLTIGIISIFLSFFHSYHRVVRAEDYLVLISSNTEHENRQVKGV